jgi:hypothetical protein
MYLEYIFLLKCRFFRNFFVTINGLFILGNFFIPAVGLRELQAKEELLRMKTAAPLELSLAHPSAFCGKKIIFHSIQSLQFHQADIIGDSLYSEADVLAFVETRTVW